MSKLNLYPIFLALTLFAWLAGCGTAALTRADPNGPAGRDQHAQTYHQPAAMQPGLYPQQRPVVAPCGCMKIGRRKAGG